MPVVLRVQGFKFWFYSADLSEPPHVHVGYQGKEAKFWLLPIELARFHGFRTVELNQIEKIIRENHNFLYTVWLREQEKYVNR